MTSINDGLLHRAFSVFLFRPSDGRLLLQKRASEKITFPDMWTNTCCSHPLYIKSEIVEEGQAGEYATRGASALQACERVGDASSRGGATGYEAAILLQDAGEA